MRYEDAVAVLAATTNWHKSSYSVGDNGCVEVATATNWYKSSYSVGENGCVEVAAAPTVVGVRDSKLGSASPILAFRPEVWGAFIGGLTHR